MPQISLRSLRPDEALAAASLIHASTNAWYLSRGKGAIFTGKPQDCSVFVQVYEALDPGCCLVAVDAEAGTLLGSCFYHPRSTHLSVGIVNTHPEHFGKGIARQLLEFVLALAAQEGKPVRLVSSAQNLDSFSLYTRLGFVPQLLFQDLLLPDPARLPPVDPHVRPVTPTDLSQLVALEQELVGIEREKDYRYFIENALGIWSGSVYVGERGTVEGYLFAVAHPASNLLGPGVARTEEVAAALLVAERRKHPANPVCLVPATAAALVRQLYRWGARNCELHLAQVVGAWSAPRGVVMPTFLPETG